MGDKRSESSESSGGRRRLSVLGQVPPPTHGSNAMTKLMLDALGDLGADCIHVDKALSKTMDEVERLVSEAIEKNKVGDHLRLLGPKYGADKYQALYQADVFAFPTQYPKKHFHWSTWRRWPAARLWCRHASAASST
jgi:hypothetical protein